MSHCPPIRSTTPSASLCDPGERLDGGAAFLSRSKSHSFQLAIARLRRYAPWADPLVIEGESGTGKTELARLVHTWSSRAARTFREISLANISDSIASSALFGHVRGAYTDATYNRAGFFQSAHGGTLFLDELGKASIDVQRRLLRIVESGRMYPVGSDVEVRVDVRVVLATSVPMKELVRGDLLLRDLYARLRAFTVQLPTLRERPEDIPELVRHFLLKHAPTHGYATPPTLAREALSTLCRASWPYNVRELEAAVIALIVEAHPEQVITAEHFHGDLLREVAESANSPRKRWDAERVAHTFIATEHNVAQTADVLGIGRETVREHLRRAGIDDTERKRLVKAGRRRSGKQDREDPQP